MIPDNLFDGALLAIALVLILLSPHPWIGLCGAAILMVVVPFRCHIAVWQARAEWNKRKAQQGK